MIKVDTPGAVTCRSTYVDRTVVNLAFLTGVMSGDVAIITAVEMRAFRIGEFIRTPRGPVRTAGPRGPVHVDRTRLRCLAHEKLFPEPRVSQRFTNTFHN